MPRNRKMKHKASPRSQCRPPSSPSSQPSKPPLPSFVPSQSTAICTPGSSPLEQLPDKVLLQIFEHVDEDECRNSATLRLSKRLLPWSIQAFYHTIDTLIPSHIVNLYAILRHRPALRDCPRAFYMSACRQGRKPVPEVPIIRTNPPASKVEGAAGTELQDELANPLDGILSTSEEPFDPSRYRYCGELVRDLLRLLPNLESLHLCNKALFHAIFQPEFIAQDHFTALTSLTLSVSFPLTEKRDRMLNLEDYDAPEDSNICPLLARLPSLKSVEFVGNKDHMPCAKSYGSSSIALLPRSWSLEEFEFITTNALGDIGVVFESFASTLRDLRLSCMECTERLKDDLLLLPTSLSTLHITLGPESCGGATRFRPLRTVIDKAVLRLIHLKELKLCGPLVSRSFWSSVSRLQELEHLRIGYHLHLVGKDVLALVNGPRRLTNLKCLCLNLCHCPVDPSEDLTRRPRWEEEFKLVDANKILRALKRAGINTGGNLQCAARFCDRNDGHECSRRYAPI